MRTRQHHPFARPVRALAALGALLCVAAASAGTFLPPATDLPKAVNVIDPQTGSNHIINEYVGGLQNYNQIVSRPDGNGQKIGTLMFNFAGYKGQRATDPANGGNTIGGAAIRGGFKLNEGFVVNQGWNLRWLQTFIEQIPGQADTSHVDGTPFYPNIPQPPLTSHVDGTPFYPNFPIAGVTAALFDVPFDLLTRNIRVSFQSGLVAVDKNNPNNVEYIGTFLWGYSINNGVVNPEAPSFWGPPTQNWLNTITGAFPNMNLTQGSSHVKFIPAPGTLALLTVGVITATRRRRAA